MCTPWATSPSAPVPRAGAIAEGEASTVADVLIHQIGGGPEPSPFAGEVVCFVEMGDQTIGKVNVKFLSGPAPTALFTPPSLEGTRAAEPEVSRLFAGSDGSDVTEDHRSDCALLGSFWPADGRLLLDHVALTC